jgi:transglutaminase-like putative cysteine protease
MSISQALALFTHLVALVGFFAISITGYIDLVSICLFAIALAISFINSRLKRPYYLNPKVSAFFAGCILLYVSISLFLGGRDFFNTVLVFLVYAQILKLLGKKDTRDTVQIQVLSFFQFLAGAILTVDLYYAVAFIVYISVALWATMVFTMYRDSTEASCVDNSKVITPLFLCLTLVISFAIFVLTALTFVSMPRVKTGFFMSGIARAQLLRSGFSEEVELGQVGRIKLDDSPVMMVRILNRDFQSLPQPIYIRGIALDEFDGSVWRIGGFNYKVHRKKHTDIIKVREVQNKTLLFQEIITEPLNTNVLFAVSAPVGFRGLMDEKLIDLNDSYMLPNRVSSRLRYIAYSDISRPSVEELKSDGGGYPTQIKKRYLQLPQLNRKVRELAIKLTASGKNTYEKVYSVMRYLAENMNYTLTLKGGEGAFPIEEFLFRNRAGHCEYFATAMVVLLRSAGIPSRIVNGFMGGEWNEHGRFILIRERHAHSWVEVFFPKYGWVSFDPTPYDVGVLAYNGELSFFKSYLEYIRYRWSRYVVEFSQRDQRAIFNRLQSGWKWQRSKLKNGFNLKFESRGKKVFILSGVLVLFAWAFIAFRPYRASGMFWFRNRGSEKKATVIYREALLLLSKKGFVKSDFLTPREFAEEVVRSGVKELAVFKELTDKYMAIRFKKTTTESEIKKLEELFARLKKSFKGVYISTYTSNNAIRKHQ